VLAGRYVLQEELGRTGLGIAWRATDMVLDRQVVVKLIQPALAQDPVFAEQFASRARAAALLSHPVLARLLDAGTDEGAAFLVREYVPGDSVRVMLGQTGPQPPLEAARLVASVLDSLDDVHDAGLLHPAITPENVIVSNDASIRLTDVAMSHAVIATLAQHHSSSLAENQLAVGDGAGEAVDEQTEIRHAGALLFELLTGQPSSEGTCSPRSIRRDVPRELDAVVARALSQERSDRFRTTADFSRALRAMAEDRGRAPRPVGPANPDELAQTVGASRSTRSRSIFRIWLAVPLLVALVAALAVVAGLSLGKLELGGPVGIRLKHEAPRAALEGRTLRTSVAAFDPYGDKQENDSGTSYAADGDSTTVWKSENYFDGQLHKAGMGLLFDLGESRTVTGFRLETPFPGFEFRVAVGDDTAALADETGPTMIATAGDRQTMEPVTGRYLLLWFTTVVPVDDGHRVEIAEFHVLGY
jgi:hypothetical protein